MKKVCALLAVVTVVSAIPPIPYPTPVSATPPIPYPTPEHLYSSCASLTCPDNNTCRAVFNPDDLIVYAACREFVPPGNDVCEIGKPLLRYGPDGLNDISCDGGSGVACPSGYACHHRYGVCCQTAEPPGRCPSYPAVMCTPEDECILADPNACNPPRTLCCFTNCGTKCLEI